METEAESDAATDVKLNIEYYRSLRECAAKLGQVLKDPNVALWDAKIAELTRQRDCTKPTSNQIRNAEQKVNKLEKKVAGEVEKIDKFKAELAEAQAKLDSQSLLWWNVAVPSSHKRAAFAMKSNASWPKQPLPPSPQPQRQ